MDGSGARPGVLFDVDGTLVDTNYLHTLAWSRALRDAGEWAPMHAIHRLVGMGSEQLVRELLGHDCAMAIAARPRRYRELVAEARPFPGAAALLRRVHDAGLAVVLATSSRADELARAKEVIAGAPGEEGADLADVVDGETSADDVEQAKPAPDVFAAALGRAGVDPSRAVVVGDSVWDVEAARRAGLGCVGLETGGFSRHELAEAGALGAYRDVAELLAQFALSPLALLTRSG